MDLAFQRIQLTKRYPLTISRGTQATSENLFVTLRRYAGDETYGLGELAPATSSNWDAERGESQLRDLAHAGIPDNPFDLDRAMREREIDPPARAALDVALWDLLAKEAAMPLFRLLGLPRRAAPTSVTAGLNPVEVTRERVPELLARTGAKYLKVKLGSPDGLDHDQAHLEACRETAAPFQAKLRVDANGGWTLAQAKQMLPWLAERGVEYVEQPLPQGQEADLKHLRHLQVLPIFVDESVRDNGDIPPIAEGIDGVNLKLMKSGGITEALRIVATARAFGLQTMIGCMSESSVAIAAGASLGALFDHIDLDSHLNLNPDPAEGAPIEAGVVLPADRPGHGAILRPC